MSSGIPRVVYQPSRGNREPYVNDGIGRNLQSRGGSADTITTRPDGESVGRYQGGSNNNNGNSVNEDNDEPLNQSRSFGAASRRLAARNQAKADYRASERTPPRRRNDEENAGDDSHRHYPQRQEQKQHSSYGQTQTRAVSSRDQGMAKQPQYHPQQQRQEQPRPSYPVAGDLQPPQRQQMQRTTREQGSGYHSNNNATSHQQPSVPIKSSPFQPGVPSAPSTPQNVARTPLSPRSSNVSPGATSPRDYPSNGNQGNGGANGLSMSRIVNQTVASSPASMNPKQPSWSSSAAITTIDPQSIQQSNTTFTLFLNHLSNLNQAGKYLSAYDLLVQTTTPEQRAVLWPILKHKVLTLPTFPEAGEDDGLCLLRETERVFGPSLQKLVEIEGKAGNVTGDDGAGTANADPSIADDVIGDMMSPMSGIACGGFNEQQQRPREHWQQGHYEDQRQGQGQYQDQGYQQKEEEHKSYQGQDCGSGTEQYYGNSGYQPHQQPHQEYGNRQGRCVADNEREAFDYHRIDESRQRNPNQNQERWHGKGEREYVPPSFEANRGKRGADGKWNKPSSNHGSADRFGYPDHKGASSGHQEHDRADQESRWRQEQQYDDQVQYNTRPSDNRHISTRRDQDGESHYTNYRADTEHERQRSANSDAHSVRSRFSKASRSMFEEEHEGNAKRREELFEEMEHTSRILRSTTNDDVRRSHIRHLKNLREEWEQLKSLASPSKSSTLGSKDTVMTNAEKSRKSTGANTSSTSSRRAGKDKKMAKKLWRGEQILLRDPNDGYGGGFPDDKSIGLKSARSMATNARSIFDDDARSVATAPAPRPMGKRTVNVVAPETLPAGFAFEARLGDHVFMATVPEGGVAKGDVFASVINDIDEDADKASVRVRTLLDMGGPKSRWRDELLDCFSEGFCHPLICNSIFCPQVALTQLMARMQMTSFGERGTTLNSRFKVKQTLWLTVGVILVHILYAVPVFIRSPQNVTLYVLSFLPLMTMDIGLVTYFWYLVARTRKAMRDEYDIPQIHCKCGCGAEDACMAVFCSACTLAQMGRHTADYTTYRSMCCTDTGLPNHVEVKLPSDPMNEMV